MKKTKNSHIQLPLVVTGYSLFFLLVLGVLLSTVIPFGKLLFDPRALHFNVAMFTLALTIGAILPALIGYTIGDHAVKSKSKLSHHFNGMLFGILSYWVMTILSGFVSIPYGYFANSPAITSLIANILPSIGVAVVATWLALAHVCSKQAKHDLVDYKPFSILLITTVLFMPIYSLITQLWSSGPSWGAFSTLIIFFVLGAVSYLTLRNTKLKLSSKLTWSAISVSVAYIAIFVMYQLTPAIANYFDPRPTMESQAITSSVAWMLALAAWVVYWTLQVRALARKS